MADEIEQARRVVGDATPGPWRDGRDTVFVPIVDAHAGWCVGEGEVRETVARCTGEAAAEDADAIRLMRNTYEPLLEVLAELQSARHEGYGMRPRLCDAADAALTALREALPGEKP